MMDLLNLTLRVDPQKRGVLEVDAGSFLAKAVQE